MRVMRGEREPVFRAGVAGLWTGTLVALPAVFAAVYVAVEYAGGKEDFAGGIRRDPAILAGILAFLALWVAMGTAIFASSWFARVVVGRQRLLVFNMFNKCVFDAAWSDVDGYRREPPPHRRPAVARWHVKASGADAIVPQVADMPRFHLAMLDRLPAGAAVGPPHADARRVNVPDHVAAGLSNGRDGFVAALAVVWYVGSAVGIVILLIEAGSAGELWGRVVPISFVGVIAAFGFALYRFFTRTWRRRQRGSIEADRRSLRYDDGFGPVTIDWADVRLIEVRTVELEDERFEKQVIVVGRDAAVGIDAVFRQFNDVVNMALAFAPDSAVLYGKAP